MYDYIERREDGEPSRPQPGALSPGVVRRVGVRQVVDWLARGAGDIVACRGRSLAFGLCYVAMGHAIVRAHAGDRSWLEGFASGFLFVGPLLAVGTYELSRQRERGEPAELLVALFAWCRNPRGLFLHASLLCVILTLWLQWSWTLLGGVDSGAHVDATGGVLPMLRWAAWTAVAVVAFASSVVAVPMLLDRPVGAVGAIRTSLACCLVNPLTMATWALVTASLIGASLWLDFWPLLLSGPWIGHATWHVYRDCVVGAVHEPAAGDAA